MFEILAYAEETAANEAAQMSGASGLVMQICVFAFVIILMYFMMIKPQRKKEKELKAMVSSLKVGDKVVTIGGIMGKIIKVKDDYFIMETGSTGNINEKSYVKMERDAIKNVIKKEEA